MRKTEELTNPDSCMSRARPEEMTFVLLGRDVAAPDTVRDWAMRRIESGKNQPGDRQIIEAFQCAETMEREYALRNRGNIQQITEAALEIANHCPCGARPESPRTHPHVPGCAVYKLLKLLNLPAVSVGDQYEKAVAPGSVLVVDACTRSERHEGPCNGLPREDCPRFTGNYDTSTGNGCDECGNTHGDAHSSNCTRGGTKR